jgi:predicted phage baseplate assembly protein
MALPAPNLDDRRFQDLVDDAKRMVMRRCPEWTDHNVSDPGVTLIETFAFMVDQLLYRLNRVPDRLYLKFLDLLGMELLPPTPAVAPLTFWLSAPAMAPVTIGTGTKAATMRTETEEAVVFSTIDDLLVIPCELGSLRSRTSADEQSVEHTEPVRMGVSFAAFSDPPQPDDVLLVGLSDPVPRCAVRLDFRAHIEGVGVDPGHPPLVWEAWNGADWVECLVSSDETGGLNRDGSVTVHLPPTHTASVIDGERAGWLRARVTQAEEDQPQYSSSPTIHGLSACTVGGTIEAIHADVVVGEVLGVAEGVPGQVLTVARTPMLGGAMAEPVVEVSSEDGWQEWSEVEHFASSTAEDRHYVLEPIFGQVIFGPAVREPDGSLRQYGAIPERGATVRMRRYATGGGGKGNIGARTIKMMKSSIPYVAGVENLSRAQGGVDGETVEEAKTRGPILLRTRSRAVTAEDYEVITREIAPEVARVRCLPAGTGTAEAGSVRVLVVPAAPSDRGRIRFENLLPAEDTLERISARLDEVRLIGTRVSVEPPLYRGVTVVARLIGRPRVNLNRVQEEALDALYQLLNPLASNGGASAGWPFGRPVYAGEVFAALQNVRGVELVEDVRLFGANPVTGERGKETSKLELEPNSLVFSYAHQVRVESR